jgi:hypothetical protein
MPHIDERIDEFVRLYTVAISAARGKNRVEALAVADGMERAAMHAAAAEGAMVQAMTNERVAFARMMAAGIKP